MKTLFTSLITFLFVIISTINVYSNKIDSLIQTNSLNANNMGREFMVAFPPNYLSDQQNHTDNTLSFYFSSAEDTKVYISGPNNFSLEVQVKANEFKVIDKNNGLNFNMMLNDEDDSKVSNKSFIIKSEKMISLYVLNTRVQSSEGYLAIPVNHWGKEYYHCSYWDFFELNKNHNFGMTILSYEDNTNIEINFKGRGNASTLNGDKINQTKNITLNKGEVYLIQGDGTTRGEFDLTGTNISADKNIGLISSHDRCMIPTYVVYSGRNHLVEMLPPVSKWGTEFLTQEFNRGTDKGDYFRVVASEDNTKLKIISFNKNDNKLIAIIDTVISKKGDFLELFDIKVQAPHDLESIRGISHFKSDKPIMLLQYSFSYTFDNPKEFRVRPMMMNVSPIESFSKNLMFSIPQFYTLDTIDNENTYVNIIAYVDENTEDERINKLSELTLNGTPIYDLEPDFKNQKLPTLDSKFTNKLYWATFELDSGIYKFQGDVPISGFIFGYAGNIVFSGQINSFGPVEKDQDTLPPVVTVEDNCVLYRFRATELRNLDKKEGCDTCKQQIDKGMSQLPTVVESSNFKEFKIDYEREPDKSEEEYWYGNPIDYDLNFILEVENKNEDAFIRFVLPDNTFENFYDTTIYYIAPKLEILDEIDFGLKRIYTSNTITTYIVNNSSSSINLNNIELENNTGDYFKLYSPNQILNLANGDSTELTIVYEPKREYLDAVKIGDVFTDVADIRVTHDCGSISKNIKGKGGESYLHISDWENDTIKEGETIFTNQGNITNFYLQNYNIELDRPATYPVEIYGIDLENITNQNGEKVSLEPFSLDNDLILDSENRFSKTIIISHDDDDKKIELNTLVFQSSEVGEHTRNLPIISNAVNINIPGGDNSDDTLSTLVKTVEKKEEGNVKNNINSEFFELYPNPANDLITFKFKNNLIIFKYEILNIKGETILIENVKTSSKSIDISNLSSGKYIIKLHTNNEIYLDKFNVLR